MLVLVLLSSLATLDAAQQGPIDSPTSPVSLRDYGAAGDDATDDTSAVGAAFAAVCGAGGGTIIIPAGTFSINPAETSIRICSNLLVQGPGTLKVRAGAGDYRAIFAPVPATAPVNNLTFTGMTVDQNAAGNTSAAIDVASVGTHQRIWQLFAGTNLHFENMRLFVSGVNALVVNGPAVSGVYVHRNHFTFQKRQGQPEFDNSAIYIHGDNFHVTDNTFVSTLADEARTAIEVHSGSGSITGNTVDRFTIGMNLVDLGSSSVSNNHIEGAGYGISLWSSAGMRSVVIAGNTVDLAQATRATPTSWGIATVDSEGTNGEFSDLQILGNIVRFEAESAPRPIVGSSSYGIGLQARGNISNAFIIANEIVRPPVRGIAIGSLAAQVATARVSVVFNRIVDAGSNLSSGALYYSAAIAMQGHLTSIDVTRNRLDFLSNPFIGRYSLWSFENGYTFSNVVASENYTTAVAGAPVNGLTASVIQVSR